MPQQRAANFPPIPSKPSGNSVFSHWMSISSPLQTGILRQLRCLSVARFLGELVAELLGRALLLAARACCWGPLAPAQLDLEPAGTARDLLVLDIFLWMLWDCAALKKLSWKHSLWEFLFPSLWFFSLISRRFHNYRFGIHQQVAILFTSWCKINLCSMEIQGQVREPSELPAP